jgi:N-methylhydantoinase B
MRDPHNVQEDVLDGYVTLQRAEQDYGVVLRDDLSIDKEASKKLRQMLQKHDT